MTILKKYENIIFMFSLILYTMIPISKDKNLFTFFLKKTKGLHKIKIRAYSSLVAVDFKMRF